MVPLVLVHGAFHGGWCWKKVVPSLQTAGHNVHTPTLTGLGERAHVITYVLAVDASFTMRRWQRARHALGDLIVC